MKRIYLIVLLCVMNIPAINAMRHKIGCNGCDYKGPVSAEEPFCEQCEFNKFPQRFVSCICCRKPLRLGDSADLSSQCFNCAEAITNFLITNLKTDDDGSCAVNSADPIFPPAFRKAQHLDALKAGVKIWLAQQNKLAHRKCIPDFLSAAVHKKVFKPGKFYMYRGVQQGLVHIWEVITSASLLVSPERRKFILDVEAAVAYIESSVQPFYLVSPETGTLLPHYKRLSPSLELVQYAQQMGDPIEPKRRIRKFKYNALGRDKSIDARIAEGAKINWRPLDTEEFSQALQAKLIEEVHEVPKARTTQRVREELANILEVMHSLAQVHGITMESVEEARKEDHEKRGGFEGRKFITTAEYPCDSDAAQYCLQNPEKFPELVDE